MAGLASLSIRAVFVASMLLPLIAGAALAQERVGVNSAVNPEALGAPPGQTVRRLVIGQDVIFNEHITTGAEGQTQLLFLDESAMTVGPNSDLTIDQFVYDPKSGAGKLAMSTTRGLLRYVGGKLSKQDQAVTVRTTTATLAVRGGAFLINNNEFIFIYGDGLSVTGKNGVPELLYRPSYAIRVNPDGTLSQPYPVPPGELIALLNRLNGRSGGSGGATIIPTDVNAVRSGIDQTLGVPGLGTLVDQFLLSLSSGNSNQQLNPQPNPVGQVIGCAAAGNCSIQTVGTVTSPPPGPSPSPTPVSVTFAGRAKNTNGKGTANGFVDQSASGDVPYSGGTLSGGVFTASVGALGTISFALPIGSGSFSGTSSTLGAFTGTSFLSADGTFFYATITPTAQPAERVFIEGGSAVNSSFFQPTGSGLRPDSGTNTRVFAFSVQQDPALQSNIPFVRPQQGGNLANASVSKLLVVAPATTAIGNASSLSAARALQGSIAIDGQGANQRSTIEVTAGTFNTLQSSGQPILNAQMRGSSLQSAGGTPVALGSAVSSMVDANGNSFYGTDAITGFALDQTAYASTGTTGTVGSAVIPSTATETTQTGATTSYGFAQPALSSTVPSNGGTTVGTNRTTQSLSGHFGGLMYSNTQTSPYILSGGAVIDTDASTNRVQASLTGTATSSSSGGVTAVTMQYGGLTGAAGSQAFVDNSTFGALESPTNPQSITVNGTTSKPTGQLYLLSNATAPPPTSLLPSGASYCDCQYLQWGYWGGTLSTPSTTGGTPRLDAGHINTWVAGVTTPLSDLSTLQSQSATGTWTGHALGSVYNNGSSYLAAGGFTGSYNFGTQNGTMTVSNFDGHTFSVTGKAPLNGANYNFTTSTAGVSGSVNGSFYGPKAAETGGNFSFQTTTGPAYMASGIYAGKQ